MSYPAISPSPPAPQRAQAGNAYADTADTWAAYVEGLSSELNALAQWYEDTAASLTSQGFSGTSVTSLTIGTGAKSLIASTGAAFIAGQAVLISANGNPGNDMTATIVAYNSVDGAMDVNVTSVNGSGTYNNWSLALTLSVDLSGYLQKSGGIMSGPLTLPASTTAGATLNIPQGVAPTSPVNGDLWTTSAGLFIRIATITRQLATLTGSETFTNKTLTSPAINGGSIAGTAITQRIVAAPATSGTLTVNSGTTDVFKAAGLSGAVTLAAPSGSPTSEQKLIIYLDDNGTGRTITWSTGAGGFRAAKDITLPTSTTAGKWLRVGCIWNADDGFWDVVAVVAQA